MFPKKLLWASILIHHLYGHDGLLCKVIVQRKLITTLDCLLDATIGPETLHGWETFHREWVIRPNIFSGENYSLVPLQGDVSSRSLIRQLKRIMTAV